MNIGDKVYTPRFCTVTIKEIFDSQLEANNAGYTEPTHWQDPNGEYEILGKSLDMYHMHFAAVTMTI